MKFEEETSQIYSDIVYFDLENEELFVNFEQHLGTQKNETDQYRKMITPLSYKDKLTTQKALLNCLIKNNKLLNRK